MKLWNLVTQLFFNRMFGVQMYQLWHHCQMFTWVMAFCTSICILNYDWSILSCICIFYSHIYAVKTVLILSNFSLDLGSPQTWTLFHFRCTNTEIYCRKYSFIAKYSHTMFKQRNISECTQYNPSCLWWSGDVWSWSVRKTSADPRLPLSKRFPAQALLFHAPLWI